MGHAKYVIIPNSLEQSTMVRMISEQTTMSETFPINTQRRTELNKVEENMVGNKTVQQAENNRDKAQKTCRGHEEGRG